MATYIGNVLDYVGPLMSVDSKCSSKILDNILTAASEHGLSGVKNPDALSGVVSEINNCLNSSKKRLEGLCALQRILRDCSDQVFSSHCQTWFQLLLQALQSYGSARDHRLTLQILTVIINRVTAFPELDRDFGTSKIKLLLPVLLFLCSKSSDEAVSSVQCIMSCISYFPGPSSFFKTKIEAVLTDRLDSSSPPEVYCRCYALLARCATGGHRGEKHRQGWSSLYDKLMAALSSVLSHLYLGLESGEVAGEDEIFLRQMPDTQPEQTVCMVDRFATLCSCLQALFREPFGTWVALPVDEVLNFVVRTLAVQMDMLVNKVSADHLLLLTFLPKLHTSALGVLSQLMVCGKRLLVPDSDLILSLCLQCLSSTHLGTTPTSNHTPYRHVRQSVYETLRRWLEVSGAACGLLGVSGGSRLDDLLAQVFTDIRQAQQEAMQLGGTSQAGGPPSRKKKKKGKNNNYQELSVHAHKSWLAQHNTQTAVAAFKVLLQTLDSIGSVMPEADLTMIQNHVVDLAQTVQQSPLPPYASSPLCRRLLYRAVSGATCCAAAPSIPFLHRAISCLQRGALDADFSVSLECGQALSRCQKLVHPIVPCLLTARVRAPPSLPLPLPLPLPPPALTAAGDNTISTTTTVTISSSSSNFSVTSSQPDARDATPVSTSKSQMDVDSQSPSSTGDGRRSAAEEASSSTSRKRGHSESDDPADDSEEEEEEPSQSTSQGVIHAVVDDDDDMDGNSEGTGAVTEEKAKIQDADMTGMLESFNPCEADPDVSDLSD